MLNQPKNEQIMTAEKVRQSLLTSIEASKQAIEAPSEEDLEYATGGLSHPYPLPSLQPRQAQPITASQEVQNLAQTARDFRQTMKHIQAERNARAAVANFKELPFFNARIPV